MWLQNLLEKVCGSISSWQAMFDKCWCWQEECVGLTTCVPNVLVLVSISNRGRGCCVLDIGSLENWWCQWCEYKGYGWRNIKTDSWRPEIRDHYFTMLKQVSIITLVHQFVTLKKFFILYFCIKPWSLLFFLLGL